MRQFIVVVACAWLSGLGGALAVFRSPTRLFGTANGQTVNINNQNVTLYPLTTNATTSAALANFTQGNYALTYALNLVALVPPNSSETVALTFATSAFTLGTATLVINATASTLQVSNCVPVPQSIVSTSFNTSCTSLTQEPYNLQVSSNQQQYTPSTDATTSANATLPSGTLLTFYLSLSYFPTRLSNAVAATGVDTFRLSVAYTGAGDSYAGLYGDSFAVQNCTDFCLSCSATGACTECRSGFYVSSGKCLCAGTFLPYFAPDTNLQSAAAVSSGRYYFSTGNCLPLSQYTSAVLQSQECTADMTYLFSSNQMQIVATPGLVTNRVSLTYSIAEATALQAIPATCLAQLYAVNVIPIIKNSTNVTLGTSVSSDVLLAFNTQTVVDLGDYSNCATSAAASGTLTTLQCEIDTVVVQRDPAFNTTLATFQNVFMRLTNSSNQKYVFLPLFVPNANISLQTSSAASAIVCLDSSCAQPLTTNVVAQAQPLVIKVAILDPVYNFFLPTVYANMTVNGEVHNSLVTSATVESSQLYTLNVLTISLLSAEIQAPANVTIAFTYNTTVPVATKGSASVSFQVLFGDGSGSGDVPFYKTTGFVDLMMIAGALVASAILGLAAFGISKALKFEPEVRWSEQVFKTQTTGRQLHFEETEDPVEEYMRMPLLGRAAPKRPEIQTTQEDIFSKLMR